MRRICGGDGFGVPRAKRSACFFAYISNEGPRNAPNPLREKSWYYIIVRRFPMSNCKFLQTSIFFPKSQGTTSVLPKSRCRNLHLDLGNTPPSTYIGMFVFCLHVCFLPKSRCRFLHPEFGKILIGHCI